MADYETYDLMFYAAFTVLYLLLVFLTSQWIADSLNMPVLPIYFIGFSIVLAPVWMILFFVAMIASLTSETDKKSKLKPRTMEDLVSPRRKSEKKKSEKKKSKSHKAEEKVSPRRKIKSSRN